MTQKRYTIETYMRIETGEPMPLEEAVKELEHLEMMNDGAMHYQIMEVEEE